MKKYLSIFFLIFFTQSLFVGAESKIKLDGVNNQITITDSQGTPVTRVILGKLSYFLTG